LPEHFLHENVLPCRENAVRSLRNFSKRRDVTGNFMNNRPKLRQQTKWATYYSCAFLLLIIFYHHIDKYTSGAIYLFLFCLIPVLFIAILVNFIKSIISVFKSRAELEFRLFLPFIIYSTSLLYIFFSPIRLDSEKLESQVSIRACYEGTQNQATLKFRENNTFELQWTGVFFYNEWWKGKWVIKGNTIKLTYFGKVSEKLGSELVFKNGYLVPINKSYDKEKYPYPFFYLGYCKGLN
jgi:hypothetical protein